MRSRKIATRKIAVAKQQRVNDEITAEIVRLVSESSEQLGILPLEEAKQVANDRDLDLVEISPNSDPPVCRVMDYGKFLYASSKRKQEGRKKQKQIIVKEVKFRPGTDVGDYDVKIKKLVQFLEDGNKAKVTLRFRGREMAHQELGLEMLERVESDLGNLSVVEQMPKMEGRQMVMVLTPKTVTKTKARGKHD